MRGICFHKNSTLKEIRVMHPTLFSSVHFIPILISRSMGFTAIKHCLAKVKAKSSYSPRTQFVSA